MEVRNPPRWFISCFSHSIDNLKITPLRVANIPPPMSLCEAGLSGTPVDVAISPNGTRIAALYNGGIDLVNWAFKPIQDPKVVHNFAEVIAPDTFRQACFLDEDTICLLGEDFEGNSVLRGLTIGASGNLENDEVYPLRPSSIYRIQAAGELGGVLCQEESGNVFRYSFADKIEYPVCKLPMACPWMETVTLEGQAVVFGLSESGRLHANERLLASSCTSLAVTNAHLIYTTSHHVIKFIHLTSSIHGK